MKVSFKKMLIDLPIKTKLRMIILGITIVFFLYMVLFFSFRQKKLLYDGLVSKAKGINKLLAVSLGPSVSFMDKETAETVLKHTEAVKEMEFAEVYDTESNLFASINKKGIIKPEEYMEIKKSIIKKVRKYIIVITPIESAGMRAGILISGFKTEQITKAVRKSIIITIGISLLITILIYGSTTPLFKIITGRILKLTEKAKILAEGNLEEVVEDPGKDEIGELSRSLEKMRKNLKEILSEIENQNKYLSERVDKLKDKLQELAKGRLGVKFESEGDIPQIKEIVDALNNITTSFTEIVKGIRNVTIYVTDSAEEISSSAQEIRENLENQKRLSSEAMTTVTELTASINQITHNAEETSKRINENLDEVLLTQKSIMKVKESLNKMKDVLFITIEKMKKLTEVAERIGEITGLINNISERSDLLALNAAIEATEAGRAGRRFRVVADEMRRLADLTLQKSKEIEDTLEGIKKGIGEASYTLSEEVGKNFQALEEDLKSSAEVINKIVSIFENTAEEMKGISVSTGQQAKATETFSNVIKDIVMGIEESVNAVKETEKAMIKFVEITTQLKERVAVFEIK